MNEDKTRAAIVQWLESVYGSGVTAVIRSDQDGDKPAYPYVTYRIDSPVQLGLDEQLPIDDNGIQTIAGQRLATVSVHYFGPLPLAGASKAYSSLGMESVRATLYASGIAIGERMTIQNVSSVLETKWEEHPVCQAYLKHPSVRIPEFFEPQFEAPL